MKMKNHKFNLENEAGYHRSLPKIRGLGFEIFFFFSFSRIFSVFFSVFWFNDVKDNYFQNQKRYDQPLQKFGGLGIFTISPFPTRKSNIEDFLFFIFILQQPEMWWEIFLVVFYLEQIHRQLVGEGGKKTPPPNDIMWSLFFNLFWGR